MSDWFSGKDGRRYARQRSRRLFRWPHAFSSEQQRPDRRPNGPSGAAARTATWFPVPRACPIRLSRFAGRTPTPVRCGTSSGPPAWEKQPTAARWSPAAACTSAAARAAWGETTRSACSGVSASPTAGCSGSCGPRISPNCIIDRSASLPRRPSRATASICWDTWARSCA